MIAKALPTNATAEVRQGTARRNADLLAKPSGLLPLRPVDIQRVGRLTPAPSLVPIKQGVAAST
eukprot:scaffold135886_cov33-Tisochrysis_lutea.AAC.5